MASLGSSSAASQSQQSFTGGHSFSPFAAASGSLPTPHLSLPSSDSYFDIDDILASQQKVPTLFELPVYRLGFLNPSSNEEHLQAGLKMELPFWLAKVLGSRKRQIVSVELPKQYRRNQRDILGADAKVVDLYKLGPYFYSMGVKLLCFDNLENSEVSKCLLETFLNRFRQIMDHSQNAARKDTYTLTSKLDEMERVLFHMGQKATRQLEQWEKGTSHKITSSLVLHASNRKRKHL